MTEQREHETISTPEGTGADPQRDEGAELQDSDLEGIAGGTVSNVSQIVTRDSYVKPSSSSLVDATDAILGLTTTEQAQREQQAQEETTMEASAAAAARKAAGGG